MIEIMAICLTKILQLSQDQIEVHGFDDTNPSIELIANGWQSAMTNYYAPDQYDGNHNLIPNAVPRTMTDNEKKTYWISLLTPIAEPPSLMLFQDIAMQTSLEDAIAVSEQRILNRIVETSIS